MTGPDPNGSGLTNPWNNRVGFGLGTGFSDTCPKSNPIIIKLLKCPKYIYIYLLQTLNLINLSLSSSLLSLHCPSSFLLSLSPPLKLKLSLSSTHPHSHSLSLPLATPFKPSLHFVVKANSPLTLTLILIVFWLISIHLPACYHPTTQLTQTTTATTKPRKQDPRKKIIHWQIIPRPCHRQAKFDGFFCVLLVGFLDLLILFMGLQFLGFVRFFVQLGLLDLGICLDGKKMLWLFLFIFGFITCILCYFGFVLIFVFMIFGRGLTAPGGGGFRHKETCPEPDQLSFLTDGSTCKPGWSCDHLNLQKIAYIHLPKKIICWTNLLSPP